MTDTARHARPEDHDAILETLVEAFLHDPLMALMLPDPGGAGGADPDRLARLQTEELRRHLLCGHTYVVDERAAALWTPPGVEADAEAFLPLVGELVGDERMADLSPSFLEMMAYQPTTPHFYLHIIGARDHARGQGLGSVLLRRVLDVCDREGVPAYLEATTERSAALYRRHGFEELAVVRFDAEVAVRPMLRPAA